MKKIGSNEASQCFKHILKVIHRGWTMNEYNKKPPLYKKKTKNQSWVISDVNLWLITSLQITACATSYCSVHWHMHYDLHEQHHGKWHGAVMNSSAMTAFSFFKIYWQV